MQFVDIHTHNPKPDNGVLQVVDLLGKPITTGCCDAFYSFGYHPWFIIEPVNLNDMSAALRTAVSDPRVVAVGETGLDKLKGPSIKTQSEVFWAHANIADEYHKPLIIHCVKAYNEIIAFRQQTRSSAPWILHGFSGSAQLIQQCVNADLYFSLGSAHAKSLESVLPLIPTDRLFFESDNSTVDIEQVYMQAASVLNMNMDGLKQIVYRNFKRLFK